MPFTPYTKGKESADKKGAPKKSAKDMSPAERKKALKDIHKGLKDRKAKK